MMPSKNWQKVTSRQVAELAGVSQTTVSFVLNNVESANISDETRERVMEAARRLNYIPDVAARSLARGRSNNIALVLAQPHRQVFIDEYIPKVLTGINEVTQEHGLRILVELVSGDRLSNVYANLLRSKEAAGIIINFNFPTKQDIDQVIACTADGLPVVSLNDIHPQVYSVEVDKFDGVRKIVQHLIDLGHRRIACITYAPADTVPHVQERLKVFHDTLSSNGLSVEKTLVRDGVYDPETGYTAMQSILQSGPPPTALYAMNDLMAFGAIRAIQDYGLRVPQDIAVVGFDDIRLAPFSNPPLTTVNEPDVEHGRRAAEMLLTLINGGTPKVKQLKLQTQLVIRESCGAHLRKH
jgi:DNA-binding LacI/PurR family transcriptional regulator